MCKKKALFASPDNNLGGKQRGGWLLVDWVDAEGVYVRVTRSPPRMSMVSLYSPNSTKSFSWLYPFFID